MKEWNINPQENAEEVVEMFDIGNYPQIVVTMNYFFGVSTSIENPPNTSQAYWDFDQDPEQYSIFVGISSSVLQLLAIAMTTGDNRVWDMFDDFIALFREKTKIENPMAFNNNDVYDSMLRHMHKTMQQVENKDILRVFRLISERGKIVREKLTYEIADKDDPTCVVGSTSKYQPDEDDQVVLDQNIEDVLKKLLGDKDE